MCIGGRFSSVQLRHDEFRDTKMGKTTKKLFSIIFILQIVSISFENRNLGFLNQQKELLAKYWGCVKMSSHLRFGFQPVSIIKIILNLKCVNFYCFVY